MNADSEADLEPESWLFHAATDWAIRRYRNLGDLIYNVRTAADRLRVRARSGGDRARLRAVLARAEAIHFDLTKAFWIFQAKYCGSSKLAPFDRLLRHLDEYAKTCSSVDREMSAQHLALSRQSRWLRTSRRAKRTNRPHPTQTPALSLESQRPVFQQLRERLNAAKVELAGWTDIDFEDDQQAFFDCLSQLVLLDLESRSLLLAASTVTEDKSATRRTRVHPKDAPEWSRDLRVRRDSLAVALQRIEQRLVPLRATAYRRKP